MIANCIYPLFNSRLKPFWMVRKDKYIEAVKEVVEAQVESEIKKMKGRAKKIRSGKDEERSA